MTDDEEEDQHFLILKNNDNLPPAYGGPFVWPGSTLIRADCGCECWIAPVARKALGDPDNDFMTICTDHFAKSPELRKGVEKNGLHAIRGQKREMAELLGDDAVQDLFRMLKVREVDS